MTMKKQELKDVLIKQQPKEIPQFANFRQVDVVYHNIHRYASRTLCGLPLDSRKTPLKCTVKIPHGGLPCPSCEEALVKIKKAAEQRQLHRAFEHNKRFVQKTAAKKKNTLGRKQQFNVKAQTFSMDTPDESWD